MIERMWKKEYKNVLLRVTVEKQMTHCDHKELVIWPCTWP